MGYIILFFIAGPVIIGVGNLILGPIFNVHLYMFNFDRLLLVLFVPYSRHDLLFLFLQGKL